MVQGSDRTERFPGGFHPGAHSPARSTARRAVRRAAPASRAGPGNGPPCGRWGGRREGVALAGAMVREPGAFLMDEPLSNLDAKLRSATRTELIELHRRL